MTTPTSTNPRRYVVGFLFNEDLSEVLLIRKNKPEWQAGRLNGIGGKVEPGETNHEAMQREANEEAGLNTNLQWTDVAVLHFDADADPTVEHCLLHVFAARDNDDEDFHMAKTMTEERIERVLTSYLPSSVLPNLHWMVPLALAAVARPEEPRHCRTPMPLLASSEAMGDLRKAIATSRYNPERDTLMGMVA